MNFTQFSNIPNIYSPQQPFIPQPQIYQQQNPINMMQYTMPGMYHIQPIIPQQPNIPPNQNLNQSPISVHN